jgi:hypothetical protein
MIVRFNKVVFAVISAPDYASLLDGRPEQRVGCNSIHLHFGAGSDATREIAEHISPRKSVIA